MKMPPEKLPSEDKQILCIECQINFTFTIGEQCYFLSKGLIEPKRCPDCRKARRDSLNFSRGAGGGSQ